MDRGKRIIGVVVVIVSVFTLIAWEKWGKDRFLYDEILVLNKNVEKGTVITEEMLSEKRIGGTEKDCLSADDREYVIGQEAAFFVHKGVPLFREYFQQSSLSADEERGQYLLSVPADWLTCMPGRWEEETRSSFFAAAILSRRLWSLLWMRKRPLWKSSYRTNRRLRFQKLAEAGKS